MPLFLKKQPVYKPGSVSRRNGTFVIYLRTGVTTRLQRPTPRHRASNPTYPIYMALQPIMRTAHCIAATSGGLLPRLFTLTPPSCDEGAVLLCYADLPSRTASR